MSTTASTTASTTVSPQDLGRSQGTDFFHTDDLITDRDRRSGTGCGPSSTTS
jgi:hypothetical protein